MCQISQMVNQIVNLSVRLSIRLLHYLSEGLSPAEGLRVVGLADLYDVQQGLHARSPQMPHVEALEKLKITLVYLRF